MVLGLQLIVSHIDDVLNKMWDDDNGGDDDDSRRGFEDGDRKESQ